MGVVVHVTDTPRATAMTTLHPPKRADHTDWVWVSQESPFLCYLIERERKNMVSKRPLGRSEDATLVLHNAVTTAFPVMVDSSGYVDSLAQPNLLPLQPYGSALAVP
jgi:hypothetical protein